MNLPRRAASKRSSCISLTRQQVFEKRTNCLAGPLQWLTHLPNSVGRLRRHYRRANRQVWGLQSGSSGAGHGPKTRPPPADSDSPTPDEPTTQTHPDRHRKTRRAADSGGQVGKARSNTRRPKAAQLDCSFGTGMHTKSLKSARFANDYVPEPLLKTAKNKLNLIKTSHIERSKKDYPDIYSSMALC